MGRIQAARKPRRCLPLGLVATAFLASILVSTPASAAQTPTPSPCQPWGDEPTEGADLWAEVAEDVPTFAGVYVDEEARTLHVLLTDDGQSLTAAVHALQTIVRSHVLCEFNPVAEEAKYSYAELKAWDDQMIDVLSIPGTVSSGIDEAANRLEVGVEDLARHRPGVESFLAEVGIPLEVVNIMKRGPVQLGIEHPPPWELIGFGLTSLLVGAVAFLAWRRRL